MKLELSFPLKTISALNERQHFMARSRRVKAERNRVRLALLTSRLQPPKGLLQISLTRISARALDDDNLAGALKGVRDQIACWLGIDDRSPLAVWHYSQETGESGVRVTIQALDHTPATPTATARM